MPEPYTRIRVELCFSRGRQVEVKQSFSFRVPLEAGTYLETLKKLSEAWDFDIDGWEEIEKAVVQAERELLRSTPEPTFKESRGQLLRKHREMQQKRIDPVARRQLGSMAEVFKRIPYRDFRLLPENSQQDLILWLCHRDHRAKLRLYTRGLRWKSYEQGKPETLFLGGKREAKSTV